MIFLYTSDGMIHKIVANLPWPQVKEVKKASIMEKTKKNVALEASLFRLLIENPAWRKNWKLFFSVSWLLDSSSSMFITGREAGLTKD